MENSNENKPHRVIYKHGSLIRTRICRNKLEADEFSSTVNGTVQLATENPNIVTKRCFAQSPRRNKCKCGNGKITAEEQCYSCTHAVNKDSTQSLPRSRAIFGKSSTQTFLK